MRASTISRSASAKRVAPAFVLALLAAGCGGAGSAPGGAPSPARASDAEWRSLATPRPAPLPGAPRVSVAEVRVLAPDPWGMPQAVDARRGVVELVAAGLLRRQDVRYVERGRFAAAAEAERQGRARPAGAPAAGVSEGPEFIASAVWSAAGLDSAWVDLRLSDAETGSVAGSVRVATANDADPAAVARSVVAAILGTLDALQRRPAWDDPVTTAAPSPYRASGIPLAAVEEFFRGVAAEGSWDWESARAGYQAALDRGGPGFFEARAALARTARLRNGGTLGVG